MANIETAAQREENVRHLARRITAICSEFYDSLSAPLKEELLSKVDELDDAMNAYREHQQVWDSQLIDTVIDINGVKIKTHEISTFDSVMDKAREIVCMTPPAREVK